MAEASPRLSELLSDSRRPALVGLAKNTGKTETLSAILAEHAASGRAIAVTSIGRDGEEHDVIDARICKPRLQLVAGTLVASTAALLRSSGVAHERLVQTGIRTPLGEVVIARMLQTGAVEVAGPSAAADVRAVSDAMIELGAEQVLIDGAIDRRAASSPDVADGLVMATGAVLGTDVEQVVAATAAAVEVVRLPRVDGPGASPAQAAPRARVGAGEPADSGAQEPVPVDRALVLSGEAHEIEALLLERPTADSFAIHGALGERFLNGLLAARVARAGRELRIVAADPTKVFLARRPPSWYRRQGISIEVQRGIELRAITVNPVAPQSHALDSAQLCERLAAAITEVPVLDVRDTSYLAASA